MSVFAELADGRRLEFPDGTDPSVIQSTVKKMVGGDAPAQLPPTTDEIARMQKSSYRGEHPVLAAAGDFIQGNTGIVRGIMNLPGNIMDALRSPTLSELVTGKQNTPSLGDRTYDTKIPIPFTEGKTVVLGVNNPMARSDTAAAVVGGLTDAPAYAVGSGAMKAAEYLPEIGKLAPWVNNYIRGILGGTAAGATVGGITNGSEGAQSGALGGAAVSAALPVAIRTVVAGSDVVRNLLGSITKSGRISTGQRLAIDQLAPNERAAVYEILNPSAPSKTTLGTQLTVPQIIAQRNVGQQSKSMTGARLAALEDEVAQRQGGESLLTNRAAQQGEVQGTLDSLAGGKGAPVDPLLGTTADDTARAAAEAQRSAVANQLYPKGNVSGDSALDEILGRPAVRSALGVEEKSVANIPASVSTGTATPARTVHAPVFNDWQMTPYSTDLPAVFEQYSVKSLGNQYRLLDKQINSLMKTGQSTDELLAGRIRSAKDDLGKWLSEKSPEWARANGFFAMQSRPVNAMEVGAALKGKAQTSDAAFLKATGTEDAQAAIIRQATGRPNKQLTDVFNLGQMSKVADVRNSMMNEQERKAMADAVRANLSDEKLFQLPSYINMYVAVANKLIRDKGNASAAEVHRGVAQALENPDLFRQLISKKISSENLRNKIWRPQPLVGAGIGVGAGLLTGQQP